MEDTLFKKGDQVFINRKGPHYREFAEVVQVEEGYDGVIYYTLLFGIEEGKGKNKHIRYERATGFTCESFTKA